MLEFEYRSHHACRRNSTLVFRNPRKAALLPTLYAPRRFAVFLFPKKLSAVAVQVGQTPPLLLCHLFQDASRSRIRDGVHPA